MDELSWSKGYCNIVKSVDTVLYEYYVKFYMVPLVKSSSTINEIIKEKRNLKLYKKKNLTVFSTVLWRYAF